MIWFFKNLFATRTTYIRSKWYNHMTEVKVDIYFFSLGLKEHIRKLTQFIESQKTGSKNK